MDTVKLAINRKATKCGKKGLIGSMLTSQVKIGVEAPTLASYFLFLS